MKPKEIIYDKEREEFIKMLESKNMSKELMNRAINVYDGFGDIIDECDQMINKLEDKVKVEQ